MEDRTQGYLARAWADLTSDDGWWQVVLVLGLVNCVPIVGQVFTMGYLFDWAKEGAWGMSRPMPREVGDIKRRGKYGLIWLAITFVWTVPVWLVGRILGVIPVVGGLLHFLCAIVLIVALVVSAAAVLRGLIYERVLPGLQVDRILKMARRDLPGLARVFCIWLMLLAVTVIALILVMIPAIPFIASIMGLSTGSVFGIDMIPVLVLGILTIVVSLFVWLAATICATAVLALFTRTMGYWLGQFEPGKWGSPHDPMPFEEEEGARAAGEQESAPSAPEGTDAPAEEGRGDAAAEEEAPGPAEAERGEETRQSTVTGWRSCTNAASEGDDVGATDEDDGADA